MSNNKPVLFRLTNNLGIGGVQKRLFELLPELSKYYEVHIITYNEKGILFDEFRKKGINVHFIKTKGRWDLKSIKKIANVLKQYNADILHTHSYGGSIRGIIAGKIANISHIYSHIHINMNTHWYGKWGIKRFSREFKEKILHKLFVNNIIFVSNTIKNEYLSTLEMGLSKKCAVLYNGFNIENFPIKKVEQKDNYTIAIMSRIEPDKNLDFFVKVANSLKENNNINFLVIGGGSYLSSLKELTKTYGIYDKFEFTGALKEPHKKLSQADLIVFASQNEGLPAGLIEPLIMKIPVLSVNNKINNEVISLGNGGYCLDENIELFNKQILEIFDNYINFYNNLNFDNYRETFNIKNLINKYLELYQYKQ